MSTSLLFLLIRSFLRSAYSFAVLCSPLWLTFVLYVFWGRRSFIDPICCNFCMVLSMFLRLVFGQSFIFFARHQLDTSLHSKHFRASSSRKLGREQKKKEWRGRGKGAKETLARKPHGFEKLRSPTNAASDWHGSGSVDYYVLTLETSIKPGMLCLRASQIWFHLICGRRLQMLWNDVYLNRVLRRFIRSKSSKYNWRSSSGD